MSRIYVDRVTPYQSASVTIDNLSAPTLTSKTEFNSYTSSNDSKVTNLINDTGSYARLDASNTFTGGQQIASGSSEGGRFTDEFTYSSPSTTVYYTKDSRNQGRTVYLTSGQSPTGVAGEFGNYNTYAESYLNFPTGYGRWYSNLLEYKEAVGSGGGAGYYGFENIINGGGQRTSVVASGSLIRYATSDIQDNYNGHTLISLQGQGINIGTDTSAYTQARDGINIGSSAGAVNFGGATTFGNTATFENTVEFQAAISASAGVTGSFSVNGGETTLNGNTTVNAEKLIIDNPNGNHLLEVNANAVAQFKGNTNQYNESTSYSVTRQQGKTTELYMNAYSSSYDNGFRVIGDDSFNGFKLQDWNGSYTWNSWMEVAKDSKVSVKRVLNLEAQDPLPAGALGDLSVSGSSLYFHNGTSWGVIS